jgi:hypothetical protein
VDTHLFQALTLGLLLIVIVVLFVVVSMMGKVRAALEAKGAAREPGTEVDSTATAQAVDAQELEPASTHDTYAAFEAEESRDAAQPVAESVEEPVEAEVQSSPEAEIQSVSSTAGADEPDSERPYERGGRWYFRRSGELLVYEEGTGEWIPATSAPADESEPEPAARQEPVAAQEPEPITTSPVQSHAEEVAASTEPAAAEPDVAEQSQPSTSFGGQPVATVDDVDLHESSESERGFEVAEAQTEQNIAQQSESFWKCPSCGAVNGSTATTCRMCFTPRP